ncbi:MAG: hypothetical protein ACK55D_16970 [Synechococcaceae cyanobacterium]
MFLSGSVPEFERDSRFLAGPLDALLMQRLIDQRVFLAVQSLVAQLLSAGGRLVFGGQPAITQMVASQAANWEVPAGMEPPVLLYQSSFFRGFPSPPGRREMEEQGFAAVRWTPSSLAEARAGSRPLLASAGRPIPSAWIEAWLSEQASPQAPPALREALLALRLQMLLDTQPSLAVCVGGMEGIKAEADLWFDLCGHGLLQGRPQMHAIVSTFGASKQLDPKRVVRVEPRQSSGSGNATIINIASAEQLLLQPVNYDGLMRDLVAGIRP